MINKREKPRYDGVKPLLVLPYVIAVSAAMMYTICRDHALICSAAMSVLACLVYMLMCRYRKSPLGSVVLTLIMSVLCGGALFMTGSLFEKNGFMDFMFTASTFFNPLFAAVAIVIFSVVIGFICSYFSAIMPRMCFLMLAAFIPLILSARTSGVLPMWLLVPMFGTYILAVCGSARKLPEQDVMVYRETSAGKQRAIAAVCISVAAAVGASVLPRSHKTPMGDYLDSIFIQGNGYFTGSETLSNFASRSSVNTGDNTSSNTLLFTVQTDAPMLIDRWVFDVYDGAKGWYYLDDYNTGYADWQTYESKSRPAELSNDLRRAAKFGELEGVDALAEITRELTDTQDMFIRVMDGSSTKVILHPLTTEEVKINSYNGGIYRTPKGELFTDDNIKSAEYLVTYHAEKTSVEFADTVAELDYMQLLYDAASKGIIDSATYNAFTEEHKKAQSYKIRTEYIDGISEELKALASEITADCTTDYQKAYAIEQWFGMNGFVYDLDFVPQKAEVDYFLFESRRGICSDFATAVTLMARAAGLPARYAEGFMLSEESRDENGVYHVTSANTHAYAQIYITGLGWVNFDATEYVPSAEKEPLTLLQIILIAAAVILTAALIALAVIFREELGWAMFSLVYPFMSERKAVRALAMRMRRLAAKMSGREAEAVSLGEAEKIISQRLSMKEQPARLRAAADALLYSGANPTGFDKKQLRGCFAEILRRKRRMKR